MGDDGDKPWPLDRWPLDNLPSVTGEILYEWELTGYVRSWG